MKKAIKVRCRTALLAAVPAFCAAADAAEFSKAGYWEAEGSPRRVETLTTGWEFSLDGFKTSKTVTLPHGIDEGELGFEASGCVNRQQPAWYRRRFTWKSGGARQFLHFEAIMGKSRVTLNGKQVAEHFGGIYRDAYLIETGEAYVYPTPTRAACGSPRISVLTAAISWPSPSTPRLSARASTHPPQVSLRSRRVRRT